MSNFIDYRLLGKAIDYYEALGYKRIEVPWWVTADIANVTKPVGVPESNNYRLSVNGKCLLASGEQAFLYLINKGQLPAGRYQTVTPCFRNEEYDSTHSKQFMKLELIRVLSEHAFENASHVEVDDIASQACKFFNLQTTATTRRLSEVVCRVTPTSVEDPIAIPGTHQLDVVMQVGSKEIEIGSYGARKTSFASWIYGTGLAEPRFSKALGRSRLLS